MMKSPFFVRICSVWFSVCLLAAGLGPNVYALDAALFGFSPQNSGVENRQALQKAVDQTGTISITQPGVYKLAGTVYVGSHTSLEFGNNVVVEKVNEIGSFTHVLLNKGALTKVYDTNIRISGLQISVNQVDKAYTEIYGLRGQLAFFYVKDLAIERFRCLDLQKAQFAIHVCTFEDLTINDVIVKGAKDGVHLGRGKRFSIRNAVFQTFDDAIALNAHDYASSNPELGWIEDGVIESCYDLNEENTVGYFCRILAGAWIDWRPGMSVQNSDTVVSDGRLYRVQGSPDGSVWVSKTQPTHTSGKMALDGIVWGVVQDEVTYTAGVRNVVFRDIYLYKPRVAFSIHFDNDRYSRSYYPGATVPRQEQLLFDNVRVLFDEDRDFLSIKTPVDVVTVTNSAFRNNSISFVTNGAMSDFGKTHINVYGCVFNYEGEYALLKNRVKEKEISLSTSSNLVRSPSYSAKVLTGEGKVTISSDLPGLSIDAK
jgi:hypothetical protein